MTSSDVDMNTVAMKDKKGVATCITTCSTTTDDHLSTVEGGFTVSVPCKDENIFVKPRVEAQLIKRHLKSSRLELIGSAIIPQLASKEDNYDVSTKVKSDDRVPLEVCSDSNRQSYSHSGIGVDVPGVVRKRKTRPPSDEFMTHNLIAGKEEWKPGLVRQSSQDFVISKAKRHQSNHTDGASVNQLNVEFPFSPLVTKTRSYARLDMSTKMQRLQDSRYQLQPFRKHLRKVPPTSKQKKFHQMNITSFTNDVIEGMDTIIMHWQAQDFVHVFITP